MNILVTSCGGDIGQSIGKILREINFCNLCVGQDINEKTPSKFIYNKFTIGPKVADKEYLSFIEKEVNNYNIDIIIPASEYELRFFLKNSINHTGKAGILKVDNSILELSLDKYKTILFLKENGFTYPQTTLLDYSGKVKKYPIVIKKRESSGNKQYYFIRTEDELKNILSTINIDEKYIVQEYIGEEEGEYTCGLYRSVKGEIRNIIFKRELAQGGYSNYGVLIEDEKLSSIMRELALKLNLIGSINVQFRVKQGIPYIFEINPRISSTVMFRHLFGFKDLLWSLENTMNQGVISSYDKASYLHFYKGYNEYVE